MVAQLPIAALALVLGACSAKGDIRSAATPSFPRGQGMPDGQVVVSRDLVGAPSDCTPQALGQLIVSFLNAVDEGTVNTSLDAFVAPVQDFKWYSDGSSSTPRLNEASQDRSTLAHYFADRHRLGEAAQLLQLAVAVREANDIADIQFILRRVASDLPVAKPYSHGKGAVDCTSGQIIVWSLGEPSPTVGDAICPASDPASGKPIACGSE